MERFQTELEPHFQIEETSLLPAVRTAGESLLVERTLREHASMRRLIAEDRSENLALFAELLRSHIRFEEKTLFERAQQLFDPDNLPELAANGYTRAQR